MTLTRRDLIKTAAIAAVLPGTALASLGKTPLVEPPKIRDDHDREDEEDENFDIGNYTPTATRYAFLTDPVQYDDYGLRLDFFHNFTPRIDAYSLIVQRPWGWGIKPLLPGERTHYMIGVWGMTPEGERFETELQLRVDLPSEDEKAAHHRWGWGKYDPYSGWVTNHWTKVDAPPSDRFYHKEEGKTMLLVSRQRVADWGYPHRFVGPDFIFPKQLQEKRHNTRLTNS